MKIETWFDKFKNSLGVRYESMGMALSSKPRYIVETGTTRMPNDWGAGYSTVIFGEYVTLFGGDLITVDIEPANIAFCKSVTSAYKNIEYVVSDSLEFLEAHERKIDLLYLDSFDYPYGELLELYGGKEDIDRASAKLKALSEDEILTRHSDIILPSQEHQLKEMQLSYLNAKGGLVLLDDCDLPGGGKGRLTKIWLKKMGGKCIYNGYQSLWKI